MNFWKHWKVVIKAGLKERPFLYKYFYELGIQDEKARKEQEVKENK